MATHKQRRLETLARVLSARQALHVRDAARLLDVSEMTVRRDVASAPEQFAQLGGYLLAADGSAPYDLAAATDRSVAAKRAACRHAAALVGDEETVFVDCGTTTVHLAPFLKDRARLTVVCNALNIAEAFAGMANVDLIMLGGAYHRPTRTFSSRSAVRMLGTIGLNTAFMSAAGVHREAGVSCAHMAEVAIKKAAMARAQTRVLIADTGKLEAVRSALFARLEDFDHIVTEDGPAALPQPRGAAAT